LIGGFVFAASSWQWTQWITLMLGLAAYLLGIGVPETYAREIVRRRAKRHGVPHHLPLAESGFTIGQMAQITFFAPLKMLITEPLVVMISLYLALNFAVLFQWFITVPVALEGAFEFNIRQVGLAFIAAIVGVVLAAVTTGVLDRIMAPRAMKRDMETGVMNIEYRLYPAMIGCLFMPVSLFWVGWTASPSFTWATPVIGTLFYVWGSALTLVSRFRTMLMSLSMT
jgi:MFS transporter, DHA1 family, multidrug resistance protein